MENALFAARAEMQARYLEQIEADLPYPRQRMHLLAGEIKGVKSCARWEKFSLTALPALKTLVQ